MLLLPKAQGSIPGQGTKILQAEWHGQKRERDLEVIWSQLLLI